MGTANRPTCDVAYSSSVLGGQDCRSKPLLTTAFRGAIVDAFGTVARCAVRAAALVATDGGEWEAFRAALAAARGAVDGEARAALREGIDGAARAAIDGTLARAIEGATRNAIVHAASFVVVEAVEDEVRETDSAAAEEAVRTMPNFAARDMVLEEAESAAVDAVVDSIDVASVIQPIDDCFCRATGIREGIDRTIRDAIGSSTTRAIHIAVYAGVYDAVDKALKQRS